MRQSAGARYVVLGGSSPLFHPPQDCWPEAAALTTVVRLVAGCARTRALAAR